jgi:glycosyltransferase involved in cell wall biosynthesis
LGIPSGNLIVGIIANLTPVKNHRCFLAAAALILKKVKHTKFLLIGEGPLKPELEKLARKLGISQHIIFMGACDNIPQVLDLIDVSVISSHREGFSNTILESTAMGKPIVATDVGGNSEAVQDGETGYIVPPDNPDALAEKVLGILSNADKAESMGLSGKKMVIERFALPRMVEHTQQLYHGLLEEKGLV